MKCNSDDLMRRNGIRATKARSSVLDFIISSSDCVSVQSIFDELKKIMDIDLATVYRSINLFHENGIIREIRHSSETSFYEMNCIHNPVHPHFICGNCNQIKCLESIDDGIISEILKCDIKDKIESMEIIIKGICEKCLKKIEKGVIL